MENCAWRFGARHGVAYIEDSGLAGELLRMQGIASRPSDAAMATYYSPGGKAFAWQVTFGIEQWDRVARKIGLPVEVRSSRPVPGAAQGRAGRPKTSRERSAKTTANASAKASARPAAKTTAKASTKAVPKAAATPSLRAPSKASATASTGTSVKTPAAKSAKTDRRGSAQQPQGKRSQAGRSGPRK